MNKISNSYLNQIASTSIRLAELFQWVDVDAEGLINYWRQEGLPSPEVFRAEMERNIDEYINRGEMIPYKKFVWAKVKPASELQERIKHWLSNPENIPKSTTMSRLFAAQLGIPLPTTSLSEEAQSKNVELANVRSTLQEIDSLIESLIGTVVEVWQPLLPNPSDSDNKKKKGKESDEQQTDKIIYEELPKLFKDPKDLDFCVEKLRKATRDRRRLVVNDTGEYIKRKGNLSIMIAWFDVVECQGYLIDTISDQQKSSLMNAYFPGLSLDTSDASMWRKPRTEIGSAYHADFLSVIPKKGK